MMDVHKLKTEPVYFYDVRAGTKAFEVRRNDRNFSVGDILILQCYDPGTQRYTGDDLAVRVLYLLPGGQFGIDPDFVVMGIRLL